MLHLYTPAEAYAIHLTRLRVAMDKFHEAKQERGSKGRLVRQWRHLLVANAGNRVAYYEKAHPELL